MDGPNKQICRLCLDITPPCECETIDEIKKEMLKVLYINMDFDMSGDVVTCNTCLGKLQDFYYFKSHCITAYMNLKYDNILFENSRVCRLCLLLVKVNALNYTTDPDLKEVIGNCFPEWVFNNCLFLILNQNGFKDFQIVLDPLICIHCQSRVKSYYRFMRNCEKVELRIHKYYKDEGHGTAGVINLEDMLKFKDEGMLNETTVVKNECPDAESINVNVKYEIECEEVHIKHEELDSGVEPKVPDQLVDHDYCGENGFSKQNLMVESLNGGTHLCLKCPYASSSGFNSDNETCKCFLCPLLIATGLSLKDRVPSHKGPTKPFGCCECSYETDLKYNLRLHFLKHKGKWQTVKYKRSKCKFKSKRIYGLALHMDKDPNLAKKFRCEECPFRCIQRNTLKIHMARHFKMRQHRVEPKVIDQLVDHDYFRKSRTSKPMPTFTVRPHFCHMCPYLSKGRCECSICPVFTASGLSSEDNMPSHEGPTRPFGCCVCSFETDTIYHLKQHSLIHKHKLEAKMYTCARCEFKTKYRRSLNNHLLHHADPKVARNFKCGKCSFRCISEYRLKTHMAVHLNLRQYRCDECSYASNYKSNLDIHKYSVHLENWESKYTSASVPPLGQNEPYAQDPHIL